jgi:hypothetical protein
MTRLLPILARRRQAAGDTTTSDALLVEASALARLTGDVAALVRALLHRADLALETGAHEVATDTLDEARQLLDRGIEAPAMVVRFHRCASRLAAATGEPDRAAQEAERARLLALALSHPRVPTPHSARRSEQPYDAPRRVTVRADAAGREPGAASDRHTS